MIRWDAMVADLRFATRQLIKSPGFSLVAALTVTLGVGANSTIFGLVNSMLFRPPGFARVDRMVDVYSSAPDFRHSTSSHPDYLDLARENTVFSGVLIYRFNTLGLSRGDQTRPVWSEAVSAN